MQTTKHITAVSSKFRAAMKAGDLNAAQFALEELQLAVDDYSRELDGRWELREAWQKATAHLASEKAGA